MLEKNDLVKILKAVNLTNSDSHLRLRLSGEVYTVIEITSTMVLLAPTEKTLAIPYMAGNMNIVCDIMWFYSGKGIVWDYHVELPSDNSFDENAPKNNDGRPSCYWCGAATKVWIGAMNRHEVCTVCGK